MSRPAQAALGLLGVALVGGALNFISRRETAPLVPSPKGPPPVLAADTSGRAGLAPGNADEVPPDLITPLTASHPGQFIVPPNLNEPPLVLDREDTGAARQPTSPTVRSTMPRVLHSSDSVIVPLNVRDPSALVMGPGGREQSWPLPADIKPPAEPEEAPNVPTSVRKRFKKADPPNPRAPAPAPSPTANRTPQ